MMHVVKELFIDGVSVCFAMHVTVFSLALKWETQ